LSTGEVLTEANNNYDTMLRAILFTPKLSM
jgi:hypothetical protein